MKNLTKRVSCRAIIFNQDELVVMYRNKDGRIFYTFPGGGLEENETLKQCIVRECMEEFGIDVKPIKKVYVYNHSNRIEHFFLCNWTGGSFGQGQGEEFQQDRNKGIYIPSKIPVEQLQKLPLMPPEIAAQLYEDIKLYGCILSDKIKHIKAK